jgi:lipid-binding SYLF domain-containing protein
MEEIMKRIVIAAALAVVVVSSAHAQNKEKERLQKAATVMDEILNVPDNVPQDLLDKAECIIVLPSVKKFALGIGGSYGAGAMICRSGEKFSGPWGAPSMYKLEGGNIGFQIGGQATDFVLLVMNPKGAESVMGSKATGGAAAPAAAGPKGRAATAATDVAMTAEVLSYSRSKGLFGGVSLEGSTLRPDGDANKKLYGREIAVKEILREGRVTSPETGLADVLNKRSPKNLSDVPQKKTKK